MTEPARYPRSIAGLFMRFVVFCLIAAGITWWIVPHDAMTKVFSTSRPAAKTLTAGNKAPDHPPYVRKESDQDGGHWVVYANGAFMHTNVSGSSIQLNLNANFTPQETALLLRARVGAIHNAEPSLNVSDDQRKKLKAIHINISANATREEREHMRQAWVEYQAVVSNPAATSDAKTTAENKLTQTLAQTADAARQTNQQRFAAIDTEVRNVLSADQINALTKTKATTLPHPAKHS